MRDRSPRLNHILSLMVCCLIVLASGQSAHAIVVLPTQSTEGAPPEPLQAVDPTIGLPPEVPEEATPGEAASAQQTKQPADTLLQDFLIIPALARYQRTPFQQDPLEAQLVAGTWKTPQAGDRIETPLSGDRQWEEQQADDEGTLTHRALRGGWAFTTWDSDHEQVMLLAAQGHSIAYVNGTPRAGDPYSKGWIRIPVLLKEGSNEFLFHVGRGRLQVKLLPPSEQVTIDTRHATLPDVIADQNEELWAGVAIVNSSEKWLSNCHLLAIGPGGESVQSSLPGIPPLMSQQVAVKIPPLKNNSAGQLPVRLQLFDEEIEERTQPIAATEISLKQVAATERQKRTFVSTVDGSVQYYALQPAKPGKEASELGLIMSLHGAGVEATGQAAQFAAKDWAHVIAPTNRRPFGFDWEDWGRIDALESLDHATTLLQGDPLKTYLSGHSMGGHGTWQLGVHYADRFAAIGPSAGWISFSTYGGGEIPSIGPISTMFSRAANTSDTLAMKKNLTATGVYILHGTEDKNVRVDQARKMREELADFHPDFAYYEQPGAGHWWGSPCVNWPRMMQYFQFHEVPPRQDVRQVDFTTMNPAVASRAHWVTIEAQEKSLQPSRVILRCGDPEARVFSGTTANVSRLAFDVSHLKPNGTIRFEIDGQSVNGVRWPELTATVWLQKQGNRWRSVDRPEEEQKNPRRSGPFKFAFTNRAVLVYGTNGDEEENRWAFEKARYDAESFFYRGNGSFELVADRDFNAATYQDRNVVLYGNAQTNRAWPQLLSTAPVQVRPGSITIGRRGEFGDNLACLFTYPKPGSNDCLVGVVSGTGVEGMRATNRLRYFVSGVGYPDLTIFESSVLRDGMTQIRAAGFFGNDWRIESGDIAWRDLAL